MAIIDQQALYTFISTGDKTAMYTLRIMFRCTVVIEGVRGTEMRDEYIQNLSNDKETAEQKARYMSEKLELPFKGNADFDLNEIRRSREGEAAARREAFEREARERAEAWEAQKVEDINAGVMLMGKHIGKTAAEVAETDKAYLFWLAGEIEASGKLGICAQIAAKYIAETNLQLPGYVGVVGEAIELVDLTLKRAFWTQGQYPTLMHVCEAVTGEEIVFFSTAAGFKAIEIGGKFSITGTVKDQREGWGGTKQTIINKPKLPKAPKVKKGE